MWWFLILFYSSILFFINISSFIKENGVALFNKYHVSQGNGRQARKSDIMSACREYIVDLVGRPGAMSQPDSSLNSASSVLISSPLCHPKFKPVNTSKYTKALAQLYFLDCQALHLVFDAESGYFSYFFGCKLFIYVFQPFALNLFLFIYMSFGLQSYKVTF